MKKFLRLFLAVLCFVSTVTAFADKTIYFQNDKSWSPLYVYSWTPIAKDYPSGGWPGTVLGEESLTEEGYYQVTLPDNVSGFIFSSDGSGTDRIQIEGSGIIDGGLYDSMGYVPQEDVSVTVYFDDYKSNWGDVRVHYWNSRDDSVSKDGSATYNEEMRVYELTIPAGYLFIFYKDEWTAQTGNLTDYDRIYYYNGYNYCNVSYPVNLYAVGTIKKFGSTEEDVSSWRINETDCVLNYIGEGAYKIENMELMESGKNDYGIYGSFRFFTNLSSDWDELGTQYYPKNYDGRVISMTELSNSFDVATTRDYNDPENWNVETGYDSTKSAYYTYDVTLNIDTNKLSFDKSTGIEGVEADDVEAPVEYFNLQGVKIDNPSNGLYIVRKGNNVTKQIIR